MWQLLPSTKTVPIGLLPPANRLSPANEIAAETRRVVPAWQSGTRKKKKACLYVMCAWTRAAVLIQSHLEHIPRPHYGYGSQANQFARRLFLSSFLLPSYLHASLGHFFFFSEAPKSFWLPTFWLDVPNYRRFQRAARTLSFRTGANDPVFSFFFCSTSNRRKPL